jgi:hypothetical protein
VRAPNLTVQQLLAFGAFVPYDPAGSAPQQGIARRERT